MNSLETLFGLILAALTIAVVAKRLDQPYPIALVVCGVGFALLPGFQPVALDPQLVFFLLLPPILFEAAYFTSWRDFFTWRRAILLLAFGLVGATSVVVAAICVSLIPGMNWATGLVLGSIVSPPDAAAATSILRRLRLPRRVLHVLEGESLVNDAAGLTVYRFAVGAVVTGAFSMPQAMVTFLWIAVGGIGIGLALGYGFVRLFPWVKDPEVEILSTFLLSYVAYYVAEWVHASGVLATVSAGLVLGWYAPEVFSAITRIRGEAVWQTVIFLVNVVIFVLIGLQLPFVLRALRDYPVGSLLSWCVAVSVGVIAIRMLWVFPSAYLPRMLFRKIREREPKPSWQSITVVGWTGLRGVVSLAAVLALPVQTASGQPFPYRNLLVLLTFTVIVATLLLQGFTLRPLVRLLRLPEDHSSEEEQLMACVYATEQALERLAELENEKAAPPAVLDRVRGFYEDRLVEVRAELEQETGSETRERPEEFQSIAEQRIWWAAARAEREAILVLRKTGKIGDEAMHSIERGLDLLEARIVPRQ
jgi:CPA1 family monovalent cation:H+ antiporter